MRRLPGLGPKQRPFVDTSLIAMTTTQRAYSAPRSDCLRGRRLLWLRVHQVQHSPTARKKPPMSSAILVFLLWLSGLASWWMGLLIAVILVGVSCFVLVGRGN